MENTNEKETVRTGLEYASEVLSIKIWELQRRISGEYKSSLEALQDMVKLGQMAQGLIDLRNVEATVRKHLK